MVWTPPDGIVKLPRFGGRFRGGGLSVCLHLLFVANGRAIPQGGVSPGGIVEAFDEAEAGPACLELRGKAAPLEQFAFEGGKEALAQGVIVSIPDRADYGRLGLRDVIDFEAQSHTPADRCVRFAVAVTDACATLATKRSATALPAPVFHRLERPSFA